MEEESRAGVIEVFLYRNWGFGLFGGRRWWGTRIHSYVVVDLEIRIPGGVFKIVIAAQMLTPFDAVHTHC